MRTRGAVPAPSRRCPPAAHPGESRRSDRRRDAELPLIRPGPTADPRIGATPRRGRSSVGCAIPAAPTRPLAPWLEGARRRSCPPISPPIPPRARPRIPQPPPLPPPLSPRLPLPPPPSPPLPLPAAPAGAAPPSPPASPLQSSPPYSPPSSPAWPPGPPRRAPRACPPARSGMPAITPPARIGHARGSRRSDRLRGRLRLPAGRPDPVPAPWSAARSPSPSARWPTLWPTGVARRGGHRLDQLLGPDHAADRHRHLAVPGRVLRRVAMYDTQQLDDASLGQLSVPTGSARTAACPPRPAARPPGRRSR